MIKIDNKLVINNDTLDKLIKNKNILVFDFDGTIADTESLHWKAYNELLKEYNVRLMPKDIHKYIGHPEIQIYSMIKEDFLIDFDDEEFLKERLKIYLRLVEKENLQPYQFIKDIFNEYQKEHKYILITSQMPNIVEYSFRKWEIDKYFDLNNCFFCNDGKIRKNEIYKDISKYLKIDNIGYNDIDVFEDSEYYLSQAKDLKMTTIGIEHQYNIGKIKSCDLLITNN